MGLSIRRRLRTTLKRRFVLFRKAIGARQETYPRGLLELACQNNINAVAGCRAGLANRIRCLIAVRALFGDQSGIVLAENVDNHDSGELDLNDLFTKVQVKSDYDFVYRSHIVPTLDFSGLNSSNGHQTFQQHYNALNYPGLLKPELLNSLADLKRSFRQHFNNLGLHETTQPIFDSPVNHEAAVHYRDWQKTYSSKSIQDQVGQGNRVWMRYNLSDDGLRTFVVRLRRDLEQNDIKTVRVYSNSTLFQDYLARNLTDFSVVSGRNEQPGWLGALNEIVAMSKSKLLYTSEGSSFSHLAGLLSEPETSVSSIY